jgi:hypothetical protein
MYHIHCVYNTYFSTVIVLVVSVYSTTEDFGLHDFCVQKRVSLFNVIRMGVTGLSKKEIFEKGDSKMYSYFFR